MKAVAQVDWELIDKRIPTASTPSAKAKRDKMFVEMDGNGNGFITLSEAIGGLPPLLADDSRGKDRKASYLVPITDFIPAIKAAYSMSKKLAPIIGTAKKKRSDHDTCIDRREFHALLVAFRTYVELSVLFTAMDQDDGKLNWQECRKALPILEKWNISEKLARQKFTDDWTSTMLFPEFAQWCITRRFGSLALHLDDLDAEETIKEAAGSGATTEMLKAFQDWDIDNSGTISADELADVLISLDKTLTREEAKQLFQLADMNQDGTIDYLEFTQWISQ